VTTPGPELAALLDGPSRWHTLEHHDEVTSTNDLVARAVSAGTPAGLVVTADRQTAGRGRRGRVWRDQPAGRSLAVSALVDAPTDHATLVPLAAGVAVADAYRRHGGRAVLKWPNDVLLPDASGAPAKAAGILVERHGGHIVVGMGLNLDWRGVERDDEAAAWTSLAEATGADVDRWRVLADLLRALDAWLADLAGDPERLLASYRSRCTTLGRQVRVTTGGEAVVGEALAVADDGALEVGTSGGRVRVTVGDVVHVR
jgi:BirA family transcriptional regulator, biotin operon repressor / biotin---[acetyl-CoA-carboxylase] ligase